MSLDGLDFLKKLVNVTIIAGSLDGIQDEWHSLLSLRYDKISVPNWWWRGKLKQLFDWLLIKKGRCPSHDSLVPEDGTANKTVCDFLLKKHPPAQLLIPSKIYEPEIIIPVPHPILFDQIYGSLICSTVLMMDGAADLSDSDATEWKHLCTAFHTHSFNLCNAIASLPNKYVQHMWTVGASRYPCPED